MDAVFYDDYTKSDYWDPVLYPVRKLDKYLISDINECIYSKDKSKCPLSSKGINITPIAHDIKTYDEQEQYCDLSDIIRKYNQYIESYTNGVNSVFRTYNNIINDIDKLSSKEQQVNKWLQSVKIGGAKKFDEIKFTPIVVDASHLLVCDEVFELLHIIHEDVINRTKILNDLATNRIFTKSPDELYREIFNKK